MLLLAERPVSCPFLTDTADKVNVGSGREAVEITSRVGALPPFPYAADHLRYASRYSSSKSNYGRGCRERS